MPKATWLFLLPCLTHAQCPPEFTPATDRYGNEICADSGELRYIIGSLNACPTGFISAQDDTGNPVCTDSLIDAYDLSDGCPAPLVPHWDKSGRDTCENDRGRPVIELIQ